MNRVDSHHGKRKLKFPENKKTQYFGHAEKIALKRIDAIVGNKHRKRYWKAAQLLIAVGEVYWSNGETIEGQKLIDRVREKYRHHLAFRSELRNRTKRARIFSA